MVAAGYPYSGICQVLDMNSSSIACPNLPSYPTSITLSAGGIVGDSPIICGGLLPSGRVDTCYRFEKTTNSWKLHASLNFKRSHNSGAVVKGALFIGGGMQTNNDRSVSDIASTDFIYSDGTVESGPDLPKAMHGHCMVTLPSGKVMILGGRKMKSVYIFDPEDNTFTSGPSMSYERGHLGCAIFNSPQHDNRPIVLAAGGYDQLTAEVYDYTNAEQWETSIHPIIFNMQL